MREPKYRVLAEKVSTQIKCGSYKSGERLPSIRTFAEKNNVSISTAVNAYAHLEDRRLIKAYPKSGYVVNQVSSLSEPDVSSPACKPTQVKLSSLMSDIVNQASDNSIINFGAALPYLEFPAIAELHRVLARIARRPSKTHCMYLGGPEGYQPLRRQIAKRSMDGGSTLSPEDIILTNGCQEAISLCLKAIAKPGDTIIVESPTFYGTLQTIELLGMKVLEIPTSPKTGIKLDALDFALEKWKVTACILTPNFHNPLGYSMPDENKKKLLKILYKHSTLLIEDDIYGELSYESARSRTIHSFDTKGQVVLCSSFSKSLDPGFRLGWAVPGKFKLRVKEQKLTTNISNPALTQIAMAEFLEKSVFDRHLRRARSHYRQQKMIALDLISHYFPSDIKVTNPDGGTLLWIELPKKVDALKLYKKAQNNNVFIAPGHLFSTSNKFNNFIRFNFGHVGEQSLEKGIKILRNCL